LLTVYVDANLHVDVLSSVHLNVVTDDDYDDVLICTVELPSSVMPGRAYTTSV